MQKSERWRQYGIKRNTAALREDIADVKSKIIEHYSRLFEADFKNYTENLLDEIYTDIFFDRNKTFEMSSPPKNDLLTKIVALIDKVKRLKGYSNLLRIFKVQSLFRRS